MAAVLVTGGAGFIGSHLCDALLAAGHFVTCVDDLSTGSIDNLQLARSHAAFSFVRQDVLLPLTGRFDRIFHLACPASPVAYRRDPVRTLQVAVTGTLHALELARACGARLLLASTSEVYGDPAEHPQRESYRGNVDTQGSRACYDEGKRAAETLAADYFRQHGLSVRIARIFNTYGPRMALQDGRVVSNFIVSALRGNPLLLTGGGTQSRSFCYVDDMVAGLTGLMECDKPGAEQPVNLGLPHEITVRELAQRVLTQTASASPMVDLPAESGDPGRRCPDISRARELFGFNPTMSLHEGLKLTIQAMAESAIRAPDQDS